MGSYINLTGKNVKNQVFSPFGTPQGVCSNMMKTIVEIAQQTRAHCAPEHSPILLSFFVPEY